MVLFVFSIFFFFFKQKTAYEMRISDWSSDVCSSDLWRYRPSGDTTSVRAGTGGVSPSAIRNTESGPGLSASSDRIGDPCARKDEMSAYFCSRTAADGKSGRSEEHTSELQSLMRISYAVFCLKTKQIKKKHNAHN